MLDTRDAIIRIMKRWKIILIIAIIGAAALGGIKFASGMNDMKAASTENTSKDPNAEKRETLKKQIKTLNESLENWNKHFLQCKLMDINSYDTKVYNLSFLIHMGTAESYEENLLLSQDIAYAYANLINNGELYQELGLNLDKDEFQELTELITAEANGSVVVIKAYDVEELNTEKVVNLLYDYIHSGKNILEDLNVAYTVEKISSGTSAVSDEKLAEAQEKVILTGDRYENSLNSKKEALNSLNQESGVVETDRATVITSSIKFAVVGAVAGLLASVFVIFLLDIIDGKVASAKEMERQYGLKCISVRKMVKQSKKRNVFDKLENKTYCTLEKSEWVDLVRANIEAMIRQKGIQGKLLVTGTISQVKLKQVFDELFSNSFQGYSYDVVYGENILTSAQTVSIVNECQGVILLEEEGSSGLEEISSECNMFKELNKEIIGFIMV